MADLILHRSAENGRDEDDERADRALAIERGVIVVAAPRTLAVGNRAGFREHVREQFARKPVGLVIDCSRAEYIDSSGLALLFSMAKEAKRHGIGYRVARLVEDLRVLLNLTRIDCVIQVTDSLRTAIVEASLVVEPGEHDVAKLLRLADKNGRPPLRLEP